MKMKRFLINTAIWYILLSNQFITSLKYSKIKNISHEF